MLRRLDFVDDDTDSYFAGLFRDAVQIDAFRDAAIYVDRILKGAKPADLPIQQPTRYSFVVNRKMARAMGIEVPLGVLLAAEEVIE